MIDQFETFQDHKDEKEALYKFLDEKFKGKNIQQALTEIVWDVLQIEKRVIELEEGNYD